MTTMLYGTVEGITKRVSRLVLGTMIINTRERDRSFELLDAAAECGINTLDSAHGYAGGDSERAIGLWMQARGNREKTVVITKGAHPNQDRKRVTPYDIAADLHDSLVRLKTDYIDLYFLHRDDPDLPVGPIVEALNEHACAGKIRAFGGSNWRHERIQAANDYARTHGLKPFVINSPNYGLAEQVQDPWGPGCVTLSGPSEKSAREWHRTNHMPIFAYSSLGRGFFSGRITRANFEQQKAEIDGACLRAYCHEVNFKRLDRAEALAREKGVTVSQIALAFILNQSLNVFALVGAACRAECEANLIACGVQLTPGELAWLDLQSEQR